MQFGIFVSAMECSIQVQVTPKGKPMKLLNAIFTDHPESVSESYFEHLRFALSFSGLLAYVAFAALIHALVPCLFEKTAGNVIRQLATKMQQR